MASENIAELVAELEAKGWQTPSGTCRRATTALLSLQAQLEEARQARNDMVNKAGDRIGELLNDLQSAERLLAEAADVLEPFERAAGRPGLLTPREVRRAAAFRAKIKGE